MAMTTLQIFPGKRRRYPGRWREWYVREVAGNGRILNVSEAFTTRWGARRHARKRAAGYAAPPTIKEVPK